MRRQTEYVKELDGQNRGERFVFVGGAPRSGTTLVQNMLDSHPDICGAPEFHHVPDIISLRKKMHVSIDRKFIDLICSYDDVDSHIGSLIEAILHPLADRQGCRLLSEKTPNNVLVFPELMKLFPAARFIHVVRDPRAIIASMLQVGKRAKQKDWQTQEFTHSVGAAVEYVRRCQQTGFTSFELAPERVYELKYERVVADPENETRRICRFLGIEWSSRMLHPKDVKHLGEQAVTNDVWYSTQSYNRDPEPDGVDRWKSQLTYVQQNIITTAFLDNKGLTRCGYAFSSDDSLLMNRMLRCTIGALASMSSIAFPRSAALARKYRAKAREGFRLLYQMGNSK